MEYTRDGPENPPILIVSDNQRIIIHTSWTNTAAVTYEITLDSLDNPEIFPCNRERSAGAEGDAQPLAQFDRRRLGRLRLGR